MDGKVQCNRINIVKLYFENDLQLFFYSPTIFAQGEGAQDSVSNLKGNINAFACQSKGKDFGFHCR